MCLRSAPGFETHQPTHALIERAQALPKQGASSGFKYGRAVGAIEAAITLCSIPAEIVEPSAWKRFWKLPGKDKESGRQRALQLFPAAHALLARKKDHGRAEAALLALYGIRTSRPMPAPIDAAAPLRARNQQPSDWLLREQSQGNASR